MISIPADSNLESSLRQLNENLKETGEEIIGQNTVKIDGQDVVVVSVVSIKEIVKKKKNLLFDQIDKGKMPDVFNGKRILND